MYKNNFARRAERDKREGFQQVSKENARSTLLDEHQFTQPIKDVRWPFRLSCRFLPSEESSYSLDDNQFAYRIPTYHNPINSYLVSFQKYSFIHSFISEKESLCKKRRTQRHIHIYIYIERERGWSRKGELRWRRLRNWNQRQFSFLPVFYC